ncbi:LOW QUALITY PROTEIN: hypothetical protein HID58_023182 [Brassica napus]|uniref:Uncharacterized protein n=1 Tax=Brassica napus TaxID=3708 RepID=A0ABQ8D1F8_BRANA|nr:LOW QUALITY PROTEIN: hypothetical protein HID58_023182 [Brassica napus]
MVNQFGSNDSSPKPTFFQDNSATIGSILTTHVEMSNALEKMNDAQDEMRSTTREAATLQEEDLSLVKEVPLLQSKQTFSPLVENSSTPVSEKIMEETPSTMVITVNSSAPERPKTNVVSIFPTTNRSVVPRTVHLPSLEKHTPLFNAFINKNRSQTPYFLCC